MKFVYFGYDFMLPALRRLIGDGHALAGIFTFECDNIFNFNTGLLALAKELGVPAIHSRPEDVHIDSFLDRDVEVFLGAGYPYKIPPIDEKRAFGINLHPSYLPKGRGLMPTPFIIIHEPDAAGLTVHKLSKNYDTGDILYREHFLLSDDETVETYSARIAMRAPDILSKIFEDLPRYWNKAEKQNEKEASHFPPPDNNMRMLNWNKPVAELEKISHAFGMYGSLCTVDGQLLVVYGMDVWKEKHNLRPGEIAHHEARMIVVAAQDGFVCLKHFQTAQFET